MRLKINCLYKVGLIIFLSAFNISSLFAQADASLESNELLMGNRMKLTISVPVNNDSSKVEFPMLLQAIQQKQKYVGLLNDTIELLTEHSKTIVPKDGKKIVEYNLLVQAFDSGKYVIPSLELLVDGKPVKTNTMTLNVLPVKVKADDKIDPFSNIAEPFDVVPNPEELEEASDSLIWWIIAAAVLVGLLIIAMYIRFKKTGRIFPLSKPVPIYIQALNKLKKLEQQNLPEKGKTKEYYTKLTDVLRTYTNRQFGIRTFERTSSEILSDIEENEFLAPYSDVLKSIFETSDFVKFAKVNPSSVENKRCMQQAEKFIEDTHPQDLKQEGGNK